MIEHALAYARIGWAVFPCHWSNDGTCSCGEYRCNKPAKHPLTGAGGFHNATTDEATITAWWTRYPQANIGVALGDGLVVFDFDTLDVHETWPHALTALLEANTPRARSGRRTGMHVFTRSDTQITRKTGEASPFKGVDILGAGGYVIVPPSNHKSGNLYEWINDPSYEVMEMPEELVAMLASATKGSNDTPPSWIKLSHSQVEEIKSALACLDAAPRVTWLNMAMALKSTGAGEQAFHIWDEWAKTCPEKYDAKKDRSTWNSITETRKDGEEITIASLFYAAKLAGWKPAATPGNGKGMVLAVEDIFTLADALEPDWLIEDVMAVGEAAILYGPSGSYKTFLALDLCARVVFGLRFDDLDVRQGRVLYLPGEGRLGLGRRMKAWLMGQKKAGTQLGHFHRFDVAEGMPALGTEDGYMRLWATMEAARQEGDPYLLIVIDTLSWALSGLDENASKDVTVVLHRIRNLREQFRCGALIVHHAGKAKTEIGMGGARGSSTITYNCETVLQIQKVKGACKIHLVKVKEGETGRVWERDFVKVVMGQRANGKDITSGYLVEVKDEADEIDVDLAILMRHLPNLDEEGPWSVRQLQELRPIQLGRDVLRALIPVAISMGFLSVAEGPRKALQHSLTELAKTRFRVCGKTPKKDPVCGDVSAHSNGSAHSSECADDEKP